MAIRYRLIQKINPKNPGDPKKYYGSLVTRETVSVRDLAEEINEISSINTPDVMAVIEAFFHVIPAHLKHGDIVSLGDFGSFSVRLATDGADSGEQFTTSHIKSVNLHFRPGRAMKHAVNNVPFERVE